MTPNISQAVADLVAKCRRFLWTSSRSLNERWDDLFARSQKELGKLADGALRDEEAGETEDLIPDKL